VKTIKAVFTSLKFTILSDGSVVYCCITYLLQIDFKVCFKYIAILLACSARGLCLTKKKLVIIKVICHKWF
jgi:hypothetical protein